MKYTIENEVLRVSVDALGSQLNSIYCKQDKVEHLWQRDPEVWKNSAPVLFPQTGRLKDMRFTAKGKEYEGVIHGIAKLFPFSLVSQGDTYLNLELVSNEETYAMWPYHFRLESSFVLDGDTLHHTLRVENLDEDRLFFGAGFHPGFNVPFDEAHTYKDYVLRFDCVESPLCINTNDNEGLVGNQMYCLGSNITEIPLTEHLFDNDSHLMMGLKSRTIGLYEKDSGRGVVCSIRNFPYVLLWSKPGAPQYVCIEPWCSVPSRLDGGYEWEEKPAAAVLQPGEAWDTTMSLAFVR